MVSDIIDIARNLIAGNRANIPALSVIPEKLRDLEIMELDLIRSEYYLRFQVFDKVGVLAQITRVMGDNNISIQSMIQPALSEHPDEPVQVILVTHQAREADIQKSLAEIANFEFIAGGTQLIRIERLTG